MLKDLHTVNEIDDFFTALEARPNWKMDRAYLYGMAYDQQQIRDKEKLIEKEVESKFRNIIQTTIVSDDIAIVEAKSKLGENEINYYPVVEGKFHNESCVTFDDALVLALTRKYTNNNTFAHAIHNMLRMDLKK